MNWKLTVEYKFFNIDKIKDLIIFFFFWQVNFIVVIFTALNHSKCALENPGTASLKI